jgi:mannose-6-phosphate isomerase-like protein (cupin superfamily)
MLKLVQAGIRNTPGFLLAAATLGLALCAAQSPAVKVNTASQVEALESALRKQAGSGNGLATAYLAQYPNHYSQLIVRTRTGEVEIHQQFDELIIVVDGEAKVMTGGIPQNPHSIRPGELRASSAPGATAVAMSKGNVIHLVSGTPHQVIVPAGGFVAYIDVKVARAKE